jgi:hypothetical protein
MIASSPPSVTAEALATSIGQALSDETGRADRSTRARLSREGNCMST